jgi:hypothetical protein
MKVEPGERILTVLWIGSLWTIGYIVAPTLFHVLEDRMLAGMLAGRLFSIESYLGLVCGMVLLLADLANGQPGRRFTWRTGLLMAMLAIIVISEFLIRPLLVDLKAQGASQGADFARLHGISAILYLANSLLGLGWVVFGNRHQGS